MLCVSMFLGLKFALMASLVVGKGRSDLGPFSTYDEDIFVYCKWRTRMQWGFQRWQYW